MGWRAAFHWKAFRPFGPARTERLGHVALRCRRGPDACMGQRGMVGTLRRPERARDGAVISESKRCCRGYRPPELAGFGNRAISFLARSWLRPRCPGNGVGGE